MVQSYMPLNRFRDEANVAKEEEQDNDIPLQDGMMQPLTPHTVHITPPDDDYVASATNPILDKHLKEFGKEFSNITRADEKADSNPIKDVKDLSKMIKTYDFETFIQKLLHRVNQSPNKTGSSIKDMEFEISGIGKSKSPVQTLQLSDHPENETLRLVFRIVGVQSVQHGYFDTMTYGELGSKEVQDRIRMSIRHEADATNSAAIVDSVKQLCFFDPQNSAPPSRVNIHPLVDA
ncbi:hypothetical protein Tco_0382369 [Tanacetum coccineum]